MHLVTRIQFRSSDKTGGHTVHKPLTTAIANIIPTNHVSQPMFLFIYSLAVTQLGSFYSLVAVIKVHPNPKTNVKAKTNPNPDLQKTRKKNFKKRKKIIARIGFEPVTQ